MKGFGAAIILIGVICVIAALNMDVSVSSGYGRINNLGLMSSRQNYIIIGGFVSLIGILMFIFMRGKGEGEINEVKCPFCAEFIKQDAIKCKHCGSVLKKSPDKIEEHVTDAHSDDDNNKINMEPDKVMIFVGVAVVLVIVASYFASR